MLSKTAFGVFPRLSIGFGLDTEKLIGSQNVDVSRPTLSVKLRIYDSERQLPALAIGFDGQGYFYDDQTDEYRQRERGLFLVSSSEIFVPDLSLHGGLNIYDFSEDDIYLFSGISYLWQEVLAFQFNLRETD